MRVIQVKEHNINSANEEGLAIPLLPNEAHDPVTQKKACVAGEWLLTHLSFLFPSFKWIPC